MTDGPYSEKVMDHFKNPRNVGEIEKPDGVGSVGNPICVTPGTPIHTNNQVKSIKDVAVGNKVLSHDGNYHKVISVHDRWYRGDLCVIYAHNLGKINVTPDHHILAVKTSDALYKFAVSKKRMPGWYTASELEKGDTLLYPVPKGTEDVKFIPFEEPEPKWDFKSKELPSKVKVDGDFLRLAGYYLAEGYVRTDKCKGTVGFVFGSKEAEYIDDIISLMKKIFGLTPAKVERKNNSAHIPFYSARVARFFSKTFGKGAANKQVPHWMILLPPEKQEHLLCGLWRGDGYVVNSTAKFVTISKQLVHSTRLLLLRQKIIFSFLTVLRKGMHKENYHIYVKEDSSIKKLARIVGVEIHRPPKKLSARRSWYDENYYYATIRRIRPMGWTGPVHNLEVEGAYSYVSGAATLHNCGDVMRMFIKVEGDRIVDAKFMTFGCGAAIATSSMITELVKDKTIKEAIEISNKSVLEALGGLPPIKTHCSLLAEQGLKSAIVDYYKKRGEEPPPEALKRLKPEPHEPGKSA